MTTARLTDGLTEDDLDALIDAKLEAQRDAALMAAADRARRAEGACPPCNGNCMQGRDCPARAAELRARVAADQAEAMPTNRALLAIAFGAVAATVVISLLLAA